MLRYVALSIAACALAACAGSLQPASVPPAGASTSLSGTAAGHTWYVSASGTDGATCGTASRPCATITFVDRHRVGPGDIVNVTGNFRLTPKTCITTQTSGRAGATISYVASPPGSAKIDGRAQCFYVWHDTGDYVTVSGFDFTGAQKNSNVNEGTVVFLASGPRGHVEFAHNTVHDIPWQVGAAVDLGPWRTGHTYTGAPCSVHDNVFHDIGMGWPKKENLGGYALYVSCGTDTWVYDNLIYREGSVGIHCWHAANQLHIYNNTIVGAYIGILVGTGDDGYVKNAYYDVTNNVIAHATFSIYTDANAPGTISNSSRFDNNLLYANGHDWYYDDHGNLTRVTRRMHVSHTVGADPQFVSPATYDFHLKADSPAIDAGQSQGCPNHDLDGSPRPYGKGCDIGAYEWHP
jgi:hypothetical protein